MMLPFMSISAPPELPGLSEASVWSALYVVVDDAGVAVELLPAELERPAAVAAAAARWPWPWPWPWLPCSLATVTSRLRAETMPLVTVPVRPSGEPIATTWSPTATLLESPRRRA